MEMVVLLNDEGEHVGLAPKSGIHSNQTPLHLAFSCYVFGRDGQLLLTRRSLAKQAWAGVWTNSVCGHPGANEELVDAARRRAREELNLELSDVQLVLPDFRYRAADPGGMEENEICPVMVAKVDRDPIPNTDEVMDWGWVDSESFSRALKKLPFVFSPWLQEQMPLLLASEIFCEYCKGE